jgi:hypothetical protein
MKTRINRNNYEIYFIDYFDGKPDAIREEELLAFLRANPDLKEEFDRFTAVQTEPDPGVHFNGKDRLKKNTITHFNYKTWMTGYVENDLTEEQKREVENFLSGNPELHPELGLFQLARFTPDSSVTYSDKKELKRGGRVISLFSVLRPVAAAAAVVVLFLISYLLIKSRPEPAPLITGPVEKKGTRETKKDSIAVLIPFTTEKQMAHTSLPEPNRAHRKKPHSSGNNNNPVRPFPKEDNIASDSRTSLPEPVDPFEKPAVALQPPGTIQSDTAGGSIAWPHERPVPVVSFAIQVPKIHVQPVQIQFANVAGIFDEEDLRELNANAEVLKKRNSNGAEILRFAEKELQRLSRSTNISLEKEEDASGKTRSYALAVGNNFSISHTTSK